MATRAPLPGHLEVLDGVRGISVLGVLAMHCQLTRSGWVGVQFFYVLSGFLITRLLLAAREQQAGSYFLNFHANRVLRIWPLYFAFLAIVWLLPLAPARASAYAALLPELLTFTFNLSRASHDWVHEPLVTPLWSISVEQQFYLVWPLVVRWCLPATLLRVAIALIVLGPVIRGTTYLMLDDGTRDASDLGDTVYQLTTSQLDAFATGALVSVLALSPRFAIDRRVFWATWALVAAGGAFQLASGVGRPSALGYPLATLKNGAFLWSYTLLNSAFGATLAVLLATPPRACVVEAAVLLRAPAAAGCRLVRRVRRPLGGARAHRGAAQPFRSAARAALELPVARPCSVRGSVGQLSRVRAPLSRAQAKCAKSARSRCRMTPLTAVARMPS